MNIVAKDDDYNYGFAGSIVNNSWKKNAFVTIYECILDHDRINRLSINPYEISNVYFLSPDKVLEFFNSSPSLFVPGFGFTLKASLSTSITKCNNEKIFGYLVLFPIAESISINMYSFRVISIPCLVS